MKKIKELVTYIFFGVCTTVVNYVSFLILTELSLFPKGTNTVINTWIAWFLSVVFAYVTNRKWVFESKASTFKEEVKEVSAFFTCRIATGVMEAIIMYVCVDIFHMNYKVIKLLSTVLVVILNYVGSKLFIFKKKKEDIEDDNSKKEQKLTQDNEEGQNKENE